MNQALTFDLARPWRTHPRETVGLGMLGLTAAVALAGAASSANRLSATTPAQANEASLPALPDVRAVRPVAPETALTINGQMPFANEPNPAARPFTLAAGTETRARALECLTSAIYYEAGQESTEGQQAVAQVVLNRVRHPAFPTSVCGTVYQGSTRETGCQFTFTCDGSLARRADAYGWARARKVAEAALTGSVYAPVGYATHYHANYVVPYWAPTLAKNAVVGAHIFYRWAGGWGRPHAFTGRYAGREPDAAVLRTAALAAEATQASQEPVKELLAEVPGAEVQKSLGRPVAIRFNLAGRKAADEAPHVDYVERVAASDNLRFALSGSGPKESEPPFGRKAEEATPQAQ